MLATAAEADDHTIPLNEAHKDQTADSEEFEQLCGEDEHIPADKPADFDGWVFVLPDNGDFVSVTATFSDGEGSTTTVDAELVPTGKPSDPNYKHAYIGLPAGWILLDADAEAETSAKFFNVTHACPGEPTDVETSPTPEESETPGEETTSPGDDETSPGEASTTPTATLPTTGSPLTVTLVAAAALAGAGAVLFLVMRRRQAAQDW
nr:LPXTG cell wall anchor domain-containing protein [Glycomyces sp. L485]